MPSLHHTESAVCKDFFIKMRYTRYIPMRYFLSIIFSFVLLFLIASPVFAAENPLSVANNKIGIHILFPEELPKAAALVNSNGGDWGYVVIPIQSGDKDMVKWQNFMDQAKKLHVIPLVRLATQGDYFNTKVWRIPTDEDVLDFANFLNSLTWPTKNRYIIVYNEVNRGDEWGGTPDPAAYANLLSYTSDVFKNRSQDFFIISAGMDNGAATTTTSMNEYDYFAQMSNAVPGIFDKIDGIGSHSYPNPAFAQPPTYIARTSIASFQFEKNLIESHAKKDLPVFITETGWAQDVVGQNTAAQYLSTAVQTVWANNSIAVVAPFLLQAGGGPFTGFSFFNTDGSQNAVYTALSSIPKTKGAPVVNPPKSVLAANTTIANMPSKQFNNITASKFTNTFESGIKQVFKWFLQVR